jgi:hypothetical protein
MDELEKQFIMLSEATIALGVAMNEHKKLLRRAAETFNESSMAMQDIASSASNIINHLQK